MLMRGKSPPTILTLLHGGDFCPGRIVELVEELDDQAGINQRTNHFP